MMRKQSGQSRDLVRATILAAFAWLSGPGLLAQTFIKEDFKLSVTGLSDEIKAAFEMNVDVFVDKFNALEIPREMKPVQITVRYKDGRGIVQLATNYTDRLVNDSAMGKPLARYFYLLVPWRIFNATNSYLMNIALQTDRREVLSFDYALTLKQANNNWLEIYGGSRGFYSTVRLSSNRVLYEIETIVPSNLNRTLTFTIGETTGLDGKENGNHFLCKFLGL